MARVPVVAASSSCTAPRHINVGGLSFTSTLETLTRFPHSKIAKYFNGTLPVTVDPLKQQYFFDRDGKTFRHILNFLRNSELILPNNFKELKMLLREATYFEIEDLCQDVKHLIEKESKTSEENHSENESEDANTSSDESRTDNISQSSEKRKKKRKKRKCCNSQKIETPFSEVDQRSSDVLKRDNCSTEDNQPNKIPDQDMCIKVSDNYETTTAPSSKDCVSITILDAINDLNTMLNKKDNELIHLSTNILDEIKNLNTTLGSYNSELVSASKDTLAAINNMKSVKYTEIVCVKTDSSGNLVQELRPISYNYENLKSNLFSEVAEWLLNKNFKLVTSVSVANSYYYRLLHYFVK